MSRLAGAPYEEACAARDRGDIPRAIALFRQALAVEPKGMGWGALGILHKERGEIREAIACYRNGIELAPRRDVHSGALFFALRDAGLDDEAEAEARRFLALANAGLAGCEDDMRDDYEAFVAGRRSHV